jgi:hypothetical protein
MNLTKVLNMNILVANANLLLKVMQVEIFWVKLNMLGHLNNNFYRYN